MRKNKKRIPPSMKSLYSILILITCIFMSVGYAAMNSIDLKIEGTSISLEQKGLLITEANYKSNENANIDLSELKATTGTILNSTISLSSTTTNTSITYTITIYNNTEYNYQFNRAYFIENFYDNSNITFELSNDINTNTILAPDESITFDITFKYGSNITPSTATNTLNSYINFDFIFAPTVVATYNYTGNAQKFSVPSNGVYKIELWGGSVNNTYNDYIKSRPSYGGYTSGEITLNANADLYVFVGGKQQKFNASSQRGSTGSGGATDIRLVNGAWNDFESLSSRIMVAGGAGGGYYDSSAASGSHGGGLHSTAVSHSSHPIGAATQTSGGPNGYRGTSGTFGIGGTNEITAYNPGGGGYFGGGSGPGGGGGSSFISGHAGCVAITKESTQDNIIQRNDSSGNTCLDGTTDITCSYHYSDYVFTNTKMIDGGGYIWTTEKATASTGMPTFTGNSTMTGNESNGYAKITLLSLNEETSGVYIKDAIYVQRSDALINETGTITSYYDKTLTSRISLEPNDLTSEVSLVVTLKNNTNYNMTLNEITYDTTETNSYTNNNIEYRYNNQGAVIEPYDTLEVTIKFQYKSDADLTQNTLSSILKFNCTIKITDSVINLSNEILKAAETDSSLTFTGTGLNVNTDGSISFKASDSQQTTSNTLVISNLDNDYTKGITIAMDFYSDGYTLSNPPNTYHYQMLWTARINTLHGTTAWYGDNKLLIDVGGHMNRHSINLQGAARYMIVVTYGQELNGIMVINKDTKKVISTSTLPYDLDLINNGIQSNGKKISIGGDINGANAGYTYQANEHLKFYDFYISNEGLTQEKFNNLLTNFNYIEPIDTTPLQ